MAESLSLQARDMDEARARYAGLYARAFARVGEPARERLEVATFGLSADLAAFEACGLGIETVVNYRDADGTGHTGKVLMSLPGQFLPEHEHVDTYVLPRGAEAPAGFVELAQLVNGFQGVYAYEADGSIRREGGEPVFRYRAGDYTIVQAAEGETAFPEERRAELVAHLPGKSETFFAVYGEAVLCSDRARVVSAPPAARPDAVPHYLEPFTERALAAHPVTTTARLHLAPGTTVLLPKGTRHSLAAGGDGFVCLEFSTPSMDEADRFTDRRILR